MSTLFPHSIQVISRTGSRINGRWSETSKTRTVTGSIQPVSGKETQFLPESRRDSGVVKIYCNEKLNVSEQGGSAPGDIVVWRGRKWEVFQELDFANGLINHYKYLAGYVGEDE